MLAICFVFRRRVAGVARLRDAARKGLNSGEPSYDGNRRLLLFRAKGFNSGRIGFQDPTAD